MHGPAGKTLGHRPQTYMQALDQSKGLGLMLFAASATLLAPTAFKQDQLDYSARQQLCFARGGSNMVCSDTSQVPNQGPEFTAVRLHWAALLVGTAYHLAAVRGPDELYSQWRLRFRAVAWPLTFVGLVSYLGQYYPNGQTPANDMRMDEHSGGGWALLLLLFFVLASAASLETGEIAPSLIFVLAAQLVLYYDFAMDSPRQHAWLICALFLASQLLNLWNLDLGMHTQMRKFSDAIACLSDCWLMIVPALCAWYAINTQEPSTMQMLVPG